MIPEGSLFTKPLRVPKEGEKVYRLSEQDVEELHFRRRRVTELDPGMGGDDPAKLDDMLESGSDIVSLDLAITAACNFKCGHCYRPDEEWGTQTMDFSLIESVVEEAITELGVRYFVITGGEPMMYHDKKADGGPKDYFDVVDKIQSIARESGVDVRVLTFSDVALINEERAQKLADRRVALSLKRDTLDHDIQNGILGVKQGSQQMERGYANLSAAGYGSNSDLAASVNHVLRKGEFDTLTGAVDLHIWVKEQGMHHSVVPIHYCGEAIDDDQTAGLNPLEVKTAYDVMAAIDDLQYGDPWKVHSAFTMDKTCNRPGRGVHVRSTGDVTGCSESPLTDEYVFGNILGAREGVSTSLKEMVRSEQCTIHKCQRTGLESGGEFAN